MCTTNLCSNNSNVNGQNSRFADLVLEPLLHRIEAAQPVHAEEFG